MRPIGRSTGGIAILAGWMAVAALPTPGNASPSQTPAQQELTPPTILVQASLQNALIQVKGIRSQLKLMSDNPSPEMAKVLSLHLIHIRNELGSAHKHEIELRAALRRFPELGRDAEFLSLTAAFSRLSSFQRQWVRRAMAPRYWRRADEVRSDLDALERCLAEALDKNQSFTAEALDFSFVS